MKKFYLTGHHTFSNRGCEAIVRSTVGLLRQQFGDVQVLVPSSDITSDHAQWSEADTFGVRFVPAYLPSIHRYWVHLQQLPVPTLKRAGWPFPLPRWLQKTLSEVDCVLSVGGDNYSLDYLLPSLLMGLDSCAMDLGKPVILWGASVGPFEQEPHFLPAIHRHLERMAFIAAREPVTVDYLTKLGLGNKVIHAADPTFVLMPETIDTKAFWPKDPGEGVLGLNVSPLLFRYRPAREPEGRLLDEITGFIRYTVAKRGLGVLLVPHVIPHDGATKNNDAVFMIQLLSRLSNLGNHVCLMDDYLNASQIKHVISKCRFFIGARTHSTIAALSSGVPTISIAYSIKAKGINLEVFGDIRYVLDTSDISQAMLTEKLAQLMNEENTLHALLGNKKDEMIERARLATHKLAKIIGQ